MARFTILLIVGFLLTGFAACGKVSQGGWQMAGTSAQGLPNPVSVPMVPRELIMDEVADEVDNYFRILREQQIRLTDNILTEGWIDTAPKIGSTCFEPWRKDSTKGFELLHASLQTVRRWARVRVIPNGDQYLVDIKVYKELEDLEQPEISSISGPTWRHDNALDFDSYEHDQRLLDAPPNRGWIPMGRDFSLEQQMLSNIRERVTQLCNERPRR
ncbi:MAG: hypothetical protein GY819_07225 [Planctomycetaceae bacterium]|nr:hypothetical protein [Planctomycetaceae bacterium]MCP4462573.1 hypothetical protein [Planctomycetaceae bacterium]MDG1806578.1 hypothetical protein [Pirellulaceae bacterium]MDG2103617.1 hypothetical protein [Pirellulaceae bacterium]